MIWNILFSKTSLGIHLNGTTVLGIVYPPVSKAIMYVAILTERKKHTHAYNVEESVTDCLQGTFARIQH